MIELWLAAGAAAVCCGGAAFWNLKRRAGVDQVGHILRLASEIAEIAGTIDDDLSDVRDEPRFTRIAQRCRECTERARDAQRQRKELRTGSIDALTTTLLMLHDDHRRIVDLRSEADRALATWTESRSHEGGWASRFASTLGASCSTTLSKAPSVG